MKRLLFLGFLFALLPSFSIGYKGCYNKNSSACGACAKSVQSKNCQQLGDA